MKNVLAVLTASLFVTTLAFAETPSNLAIGYDTTVNAINMRIVTDSGIGLQGFYGINTHVPIADNHQGDTDMYIGGNLFIALYGSAKGNLNAFAGFGLNLYGTIIEDGDSIVNFGLMAGLEPEIFLLDCLSVSTKFGVQLLINGNVRGKDGKTDEDTGSVDLGTFGNGVSIVEGVSFNWYF